MDLLSLIGLWLLVTFVFWVLYVWVFTLRDHAQKFRGPIKYIIYLIGIPLLAVGYVLDVVYNRTFAPIMFWDFSWHESWTLTGRMKSYLKYEHVNSWRYKLSYTICHYLLHPYDENHCGDID